MSRQKMATKRALLSWPSWPQQRRSVAHDRGTLSPMTEALYRPRQRRFIAHDRAKRAKAGAHVVSNDKLWKCRNMAFLVATGFQVLCYDSVATVGFMSRQD